MAVGLDAIQARAWGLAARLRALLEELPGVRVLDRASTLSAIVTATVEGHAPHDLVSALRARGINTSSQTRLDAVLDYDAKCVDGALRMAPHYFNTDDELDALVAALSELTRTS
jgi:selenocysteine lyase/cysteine desulfurase